MSGMRTETEEKYKEICRLYAEGKKKSGDRGGAALCDVNHRPGC